MSRVTLLGCESIHLVFPRHYPPRTTGISDAISHGLTFVSLISRGQPSQSNFVFSLLGFVFPVFQSQRGVFNPLDLCDSFPLEVCDSAPLPTSRLPPVTFILATGDSGFQRISFPQISDLLVISLASFFRSSFTCLSSLPRRAALAHLAPFFPPPLKSIKIRCLAVAATGTVIGLTKYSSSLLHPEAFCFQRQSANGERRTANRFPIPYLGK